MAFTEATVTHTFKNADGTPASGSIIFTLSERMTNGGVTIVPATVTANLNAEGKLSQKLTANNDTTTTPQHARWRVDFHIIGEPEPPMPLEYFITVPTGGGEVDLGGLLPQQTTGG